MSENMMSNMWVPLVDYRRNGVPECTIHGAVAWVTGKKLVYSYGGNVVCYGRSMFKPIQIDVLAKALEPVLNWEQRAISVSSHIADVEHVDAAQSILKESEWGLMQTPLAVPMMQFGRQRRRPRRWNHPCSGNHAAILRGCHECGWSRVGYVWPHHPYHQGFLKRVQRVLGDSWKPAVTAKDGCGIPTVSMSIVEMATLFADLAKRRDENWIWESMIRHPDLVGGFNRIDTTILKSCGGHVVAKEGADGLLGLSIHHPAYPEGLGIVIKIAHGWNPTATWFVARWTLGVLGFQFRNPYRLDRQKGFIVEDVVPPEWRKNMGDIKPWDSWDPDVDRWDFDFENYTGGL